MTKKLPRLHEARRPALIDHLMSEGPVNMGRIGLAYSDGLGQDIKDAVEEYVTKLGFKSFDWVEVGGMVSATAVLVPLVP